MGENINAYVSVRCPERNRPLRRHHTGMIILKKYHRDVWWKQEGSFHLTQDRAQWQAPVNDCWPLKILYSIEFVE
jgi:hypothetical protein